MPLSCYLKIWHLPEKPGHSLVYSTRTAGLLILGDEFISNLTADNIPTEHREALIQAGVIVENQELERQAVSTMLAEINHLTTAFRASMILTLDCNFACRYCYEGSMKSKTAMTEATAEQCISFFKDRFNTRGKSTLILDLYGGEPLLVLNRIRQLAAALKPYVEEKDGRFEMHMVTNGSLLNPNTLRELVGLGLATIKVTLDGPPENHNQFRPFKNGQPSFERIVTNLKECLGIVPIILNGNYTRENYPSYPALLDLLFDQGFTTSDFQHVSFQPVMQTSDKFTLPGFSCGYKSMKEEWLPPAAVFTRDAIISHGFPVATLSPDVCMVDVEDGCVVHYNGTIYKCTTMAGHAGYEAGDVWQGIRDFSEKYLAGDLRKLEEQCRECVYLPLCFGGCRYMRYQETGSMAGIDCQKLFFDAALESIIRQDARAYL